MKEEEKESLLEQRNRIKADIRRMRITPYYPIMVDHKEIYDSRIITELILEFKRNQIKEIDKKLGI